MKQKSKKSFLSKIFKLAKSSPKILSKKTAKSVKNSPKKSTSVKFPKKSASNKVVKKSAPKVVRKSLKTQKVPTRKVLGRLSSRPVKGKKISFGREAEIKVAEPAPSPTPFHAPVMVEEVVEALALPGKKIMVDGTLGLGGHAHEILSRIEHEMKILGFDADEENLNLAREKLKSFGDKVVFIRGNFQALKEELQKLKIRGIDAILLDMGLSSPQVDIGERGFSFLREGPLDMRFDKTQQLTAAEVINKYSEKELLRIFREYGEEPKARKLVHEIVRRRRHHPFTTTTELADFVEKLLKRQGHIHPATRIFQALRIEVNKELEVLQSVLEQAMDVLKKGGRIVVIAYHSLEDRLVKNFFKNLSREFVNLPHELKTTMLEPKLKILTKKPLTPTEQEQNRNPRSRSAKLRIAEKL